MRTLAVVASSVLAAALPAAAQNAPIVITSVTVIDATGKTPRTGTTVVIADGTIRAIGSRAGVPRGATVIDGTGKFLIPGLWDMHVHVAKAGSASLALFIAKGVTSVRDMGGDFSVVHELRTDIARGRRIGPRIRSAGPILESAERVRRMETSGTVEPVLRFRAPVADEADARRVVDSVARLGADFIKVRTVASVTAYDAIAAAAKHARLPVAAHGDVASPEHMLRAGQRSIEHVLYPPLQRRDATTRARLIADLAAAGIVVVPTIVNYYDWLLVPPNQARRIVDDSMARIDPRRRFVFGYLLDDWREQVEERDGILQAAIRRLYLPRAYRGVLKDLQAMHRGGVRLLPGTDVGVALQYPGFTLHDELRYFVDTIRMTPMQALMSATRWAAEFSGDADSLGTIEVGKIADLVLLDADPLVDIRHTRRINAVFVRGALYDAAALAQLLERSVCRPASRCDARRDAGSARHLR